MKLDGLVLCSSNGVGWNGIMNVKELEWGKWEKRKGEGKGNVEGKERDSLWRSSFPDGDKTRDGSITVLPAISVRELYKYTLL